MRYRMLSATGDYTFGLSLGNFFIDDIDAVRQSIQTRLNLQQGQWFLNTQAGTPWNTQVLGRVSAKTRDIVLKSVILGTNGVTSIENYSATKTGRALTVTCSVLTIYSTEVVDVVAVL